MLRKNSLLCKIFRLNTSSKSIFDSFMAEFHPELETCPICGSCGNCHVHDYYGRTITDFIHQNKTTSSLCIMRVMCDSCNHTHAILPDIIIPYSSYGILFVLTVLADHFTKRYSLESLCEKYVISAKQLRKWLDLWKSHKQKWLGLLNDAQTTSDSFHAFLYQVQDYSTFSMEFIRRFAHSFLQSHRNPVPPNCKNAHYCQKVFTPDISISLTT